VTDDITDFPLAYLITFRCHGTWLHGDERGSIDRHNRRYGMPTYPKIEHWQQISGDRMKRPQSVPPAVAGGCSWRMKRLSSREMWNDRELPIAYFITFRTYGTWLHGDPRGSTSRHRNRYKSHHLPDTPEWLAVNKARMKREPLILTEAHRECVQQAIKETCLKRGWDLYAANARTNHVHSVASIGMANPSIALNAFKANATRALREAGLYSSDMTPWADKGSERWLWTRAQVDRAVDYVLYSQGDDFLRSH
jgi:REP element-mobilizing transposase RayT